MADEFVHVGVTGARKVAIRFDNFPDKLHDRLLSRINSLTDRLYSLVLAAAPSRTGKLRSTIKRQVYDDKGKRITGYISIDEDFAKAGALEYGAKRAAKVSAHSMRLDHFWADKLASPVTVMVEAHKRQLDLMQRRYLRGPLEQMAPEILGQLEEATDQQVAEGET